MTKPRNPFKGILARDKTPLLDDTGAPGFLSPKEVEEAAERKAREVVKNEVKGAVAEAMAASPLTRRIDELYSMMVKVVESQAATERHAVDAASTANLTAHLMHGSPNSNDHGAIGRLEDDVKSFKEEVSSRLDTQDAMIADNGRKSDDVLKSTKNIAVILQGLWDWGNAPTKDGKTTKFRWAAKKFIYAVGFFTSGFAGLGIFDSAAKFLQVAKNCWLMLVRWVHGI